MQHQFDVVVERDEEGFYVASVPALYGCHTQAKSLDESNQRIREAIELCLEGAPEYSMEFAGTGGPSGVDRLRFRGVGGDPH